MLDLIWLKGHFVFFLFLLVIFVVFIFLLFVILLLIVFILVFIYLFHAIWFILLVIIYTSPANSLSFDSLFDLISDHHIILLFNTLQPRIFILISSLEHEVTLLINITHILLISHVKRLYHVAKILNLRFDIFFLIFVAIYIQSFL